MEEKYYCLLCGTSISFSYEVETMDCRKCGGYDSLVLDSEKEFYLDIMKRSGMNEASLRKD